MNISNIEVRKWKKKSWTKIIKEKKRNSAVAGFAKHGIKT